MELHELAHHSMSAQDLGDGEHKVGGRCPGRRLTGEPEAEHVGQYHRHGLAEHHRFGLDASDAPAEDAEAVDHRRVRVGAQAHVGVGPVAVGLHDPGQVLDVDLMHDAHARRHDLEPVEGRLTPFEEPVTLAVALVLEIDIEVAGVGSSEEVGDHGVVGDEFGGNEGVDRGRVATECGDSVSHRRQID